MRKLGITISGGSHNHLTRKIKKLGLNCSHFTGQKSSLGKPSSTKRQWQEVLIISKKDHREKSYALRRALLESGREYICEECGLDSIWNNKEIIFEIHHKDNNWLNNTKENLQFICPNCHSQQKHKMNMGYIGLTHDNEYTKMRRKIKKTW